MGWNRIVISVYIVVEFVGNMYLYKWANNGFSTSIALAYFYQPVLIFTIMLLISSLFFKREFITFVIATLLFLVFSIFITVNIKNAYYYS